MANESTYSGISTLIGNVYAIALQTLREGNIMAPLVTTGRTKTIVNRASGRTIQAALLRP